MQLLFMAQMHLLSMLLKNRKVVVIMWYEINVSKDGKHFFATHERSMQNVYDYEKVMTVFLEKFPESEGYKVTATKWETTGKIL